MWLPGNAIKAAVAQHTCCPLSIYYQCTRVWRQADATDRLSSLATALPIKKQCGCTKAVSQARAQGFHKMTSSTGFAELRRTENHMLVTC